MKLFSLVFGLALIALAVPASPTTAQPTRIESNPMDIFPGLNPDHIIVLAKQSEWNPGLSAIHEILSRQDLLTEQQFERFVVHDANHLLGIQAGTERPDIIRVDLEGTVSGVRRIAMPHGSRDRYGYEHFFAVDIRRLKSPTAVSATVDGLDASAERPPRVELDVDTTYRICVRNIPASWTSHSPVGEQVSCHALALYHYRQQGAVSWVLAARRLRWHPSGDSISARGFEFSAGAMDLVEHGFDASQFDALAANMGKALDGDDGPAILQGLAAATRMMRESEKKQGTKKPSPPQELSIEEVLVRPKQQIGNRVRFRGRLRRVTPIELKAATASRLDVAKYFQYDIFKPIEGNVKLVAEGKEPLVFSNEYPVTVLSAMIPAQIQDQRDVSLDVEVTGHFLRNWHYTSIRSRKAGNQAQTVPLIVADNVRILTEEDLVGETRQSLNWLIGGVAGTILLATVLTWWYLRRDEKQHPRRRRTPDQIDPIEIG